MAQGFASTEQPVVKSEVAASAVVEPDSHLAVTLAAEPSLSVEPAAPSSVALPLPRLVVRFSCKPSPAGALSGSPPAVQALLHIFEPLWQ